MQHSLQLNIVNSDVSKKKKYEQAFIQYYDMIFLGKRKLSYTLLFKFAYNW